MFLSFSIFVMLFLSLSAQNLSFFGLSFVTISQNILCKKINFWTCLGLNEAFFFFSFSSSFLGARNLFFFWPQLLHDFLKHSQYKKRVSEPSRVVVVTVGRDTDQSVRVCKVDLATLKVAIKLTKTTR